MKLKLNLVNVSKYSDFDVITNNLKKTIKYVLSGTQNTNYPKKLIEMQNIMDEYYDLNNLKLYSYNNRIIQIVYWTFVIYFTKTKLGKR